MREEHFQPKAVDESTIRRGAVEILLFILTIAFSFMAVRSGRNYWMLVVLLAPLALMVVGYPNRLLVASAWGGAAALFVPGMGGTLTFSELMQVVIIGLCIAEGVFRRKPRERADSSAPYLFLLLIWIFLLMVIRGSGIRALGSPLWGGKAYIKLIVTILFFFSARSLRLTESMVKKIVFGSVLFGAVPLLLQLLVIRTGSFLWLTNYFVLDQSGGFIGQILAEQAATGPREEFTRVSSWASLAFVLFPLAFLIVPKRMGRLVWMLGVAGVCMLMAGLSGFRANAVNLLAMTFLFGMICIKGERKKWMIIAVLIGLLSYIFLLLFGLNLPLAIQRTFSWIPGVQVDHFVRLKAEASTEFRFEIWRMAMQEIGRYWLIGKGVAMEVAQVAWLRRTYYDTPEFFFYSHNYHSGGVSLLLDLGGIGLLLTVGFFVRVCVENIRSWKQMHEYSFMRLYHQFLTVQFLWGCFSYFLVFGDLTRFLPGLISSATLLLIVRRSCIEQQVVLPAGTRDEPARRSATANPPH